jgi:GNAT superfamily N-acetyltransferase
VEHSIRICSGPEVAGWRVDAARLRISVFRDFPYLYDGDETAEQEYLAGYAGCPDSVFVLAEAEGRIVGVSTGLPLVAADPAFRQPFEAVGMSPAEWFYFGESVLAPEWRGRGIGHRFFDEREAHARSRGFSRTCFCAVERSVDHPLKPSGYRSNDAFWIRRGYVKQPVLRARFSWRQVDSADSEVRNELVFWTRESGDQM